MVLTSFKTMTWVIENINPEDKVALINLKVCIALLNAIIFRCFVVSDNGGVITENSSCLVMSFQLSPFGAKSFFSSHILFLPFVLFLCFHLIIPYYNFVECISLISTVLFAQGSSKIMARLPQEKLRCSLDLPESRWSQC